MSAKENADHDKAAGIKKGLWARFDITLITEQGEQVPDNTYIIPNPIKGYRPLESYTRPILKGARALSLPQAYTKQLEKIIQSTQNDSIKIELRRCISHQIDINSIFLIKISSWCE